MSIIAYPLGSRGGMNYIARGTLSEVTALYPPSALLVGCNVWLTDKPTAQGGAFTVRESSGTPGTYIYDRVGGGAVVADTWENIIAAYNMTTYDGCTFRVTDFGVNGMDFFATGGFLRIKNRSGDLLNIKTWAFAMPNAWINFGGGSATYVQSDNTVTVTKTAHGLSADFNGASIFLTGGTGTFTSETCTNFTYIDANSFSCASATSRSTSGNLGTNKAKTYSPWTYTYPTGLIKVADQCQIGLVWRRCSNSANNKTMAYEYSGNVIGTSTRTTAAANWIQEAAGVVTYTAADKFLASLITPTEFTDTNSTFALASTLANEADWDLLMPQSINYASRATL